MNRQLENSFSQLKNEQNRKLDQFKNELEQLKRTIGEQRKIIEEQRKEKKELDDVKRRIPEFQKMIDSQKAEINILKSNSVPKGFIYVQFNGQKEPSALWPNTYWSNISPSYPGPYFRVEGGQESTGSKQEQQIQMTRIWQRI